MVSEHARHENTAIKHLFTKVLQNLGVRLLVIAIVDREGFLRVGAGQLAGRHDEEHGNLRRGHSWRCSLWVKGARGGKAG